VAACLKFLQCTQICNTPCTATFEDQVVDHSSLRRQVLLVLAFVTAIKPVPVYHCSFDMSIVRKKRDNR
jgi:hypothetical protein